VGLAKTHGQHVLEAIADHLYRLPGSIMSKAWHKQSKGAEKDTSLPQHGGIRKLNTQRYPPQRLSRIGNPFTQEPHDNNPETSRKYCQEYLPSCVVNIYDDNLYVLRH